MRLGPHGATAEFAAVVGADDPGRNVLMPDDRVEACAGSPFQVSWMSRHERLGGWHRTLCPRLLAEVAESRMATPRTRNAHTDGAISQLAT